MRVISSLERILADVRRQRPLVHQITNYVSVNDCANIVLALGGAPVMADEIEEIEEMSKLSSALVLNLGTLNWRTIESMLAAGKIANANNIPVVLDPVGVGATTLRTNTALQIMDEIKLAVIRGNSSEIAVLAGQQATTRGVDATGEQGGVLDIARQLARKVSAVVAVTGAQDIITDGSRIIVCDNGHPMLTRVTGTGCMVSALVGACAGVTTDYLLAATTGITSMGLAGEYAAAKSGEGRLGAFRSHLFDYIGSLSPEQLRLGARINVMA